MIFAADFETITNPEETRVWAWALCEVGNESNFVYGTIIDELMEYCSMFSEPITLYFHNLKFDGEFIIYWLFHNRYKHITNRNNLREGTFTSLISDKGQFYSLEIQLYGSEHKLKILDSLKILPLSVADMAKTYNLPIQKLEIDYDGERSEDHELTDQEIEYIRNDVTIVSMALKQLFDQGLKKMTTGSNALNEYKKLLGIKEFKRWFPVLPYDAEIRQSYKGGFTYLNPIYKGVDVGDGVVLDVNSLYPSVMYYEKMPYGEGIYYDGKYEEDDLYPLYVQMFSCMFHVKQGFIPTVQLKNNLSFIPTEYLESSNDEYITLCMTSIDLKLFFDHYDVYDITWISGYKFKAAGHLFDRYIEKWNEIKMQATKDGNGGLRHISKLMLNSLYGKFGTNPKKQSKYPYLGMDDIVHYRLAAEEMKDPVYIPIGTFITAYARNKTIRSAQMVYERFIYADTDSLHLAGSEIPECLEISDVELGKWKVESHFTRARFLRQKSYIEEINGKLHVTCAGMPASCHQYVTWENFKPGTEYEGKLKQKHVRGGIILYPSPHTLKE